LRKEEMVSVFRALLHRSADPFVQLERDFAVDSTGFSTGTYDRWSDERGNEMAKASWLKAHAICGVETHAVTDLLVGPGNSADAPQLPVLVAATARRFDIHAIVADKAYSSHLNLEAIEWAQAQPFIPFKEGATAGDGDGAWSRAFSFFTLHQLKFKERYHQR